MMFDEDKCMNNSYLLLTGRKRLEDFFNEDEVYFIYNPDEPILSGDNPVYDTLIDYYIYTEEYEKCQELLNLKQLSDVVFLN